MRRFFLTGALLCFLSGVLAPEGAGMEKYSPLEELVARSDCIVVASVQSRRVLGKHERDAHIQRVESILLVQEVFKGNVAAGAVMAVETHEGTSADTVFPDGGQFFVAFIVEGESPENLVSAWAGVEEVWPINDAGEFRGTGSTTTREQLLQAIRETSGK